MRTLPAREPDGALGASSSTDPSSPPHAASKPPSALPAPRRISARRSYTADIGEAPVDAPPYSWRDWFWEPVSLSIVPTRLPSRPAAAVMVRDPAALYREY